MDQGELLQYVEVLRMGRDISEVILQGKSALDSRTGLPLPTPDLAQDFLFAYGYDLTQPIESAEVQGNYRESLRFIHKYFLKPENPDGAALEIPKVFHEIHDIRQLLIIASNKSVEQTNNQRWACAILRVMHTIAHLEKDLRNDYFSAIQQQVFDRFYRELHNLDGKLYLGDPRKGIAIELVKFQTKPRKSRESAILKLLHKAENVAEDLFDQVGVRFVTKNTVDVFRVVKYLRDKNIIMTMNIRPSRTRNNLLDPLHYRRLWRQAKTEVEAGQIKSPAALDDYLDKMLVQPEETKGDSPANRFSSQSYRSLQFTCRQLIKYRNPIYDDLKNLKNALKVSDQAELKKYAERLDFSTLTREQRFFYPYEVQIFDQKNHEEAESGQASHSAYKAAQVQSAMKRILSALLPMESSSQ